MRPVSLIAERAVRWLQREKSAANSVLLAHELLATRTSDEATATRLLRNAFAGDRRLSYRRGMWRLVGEAARIESEPDRAATSDPDRVLIHLDGDRAADGRRFEIRAVSVLRLQNGQVVAACGGQPGDGLHGERLRRSALAAMQGAVPVIHDPPGALAAFERWLGAPVQQPISLRRVARDRLGLAAGYDLETLAARLRLRWRQTDDPLEQADFIDACLEALRRPGEPLSALQLPRFGRVPPIDWSRFAFSREDLREIPEVPGTYRFYDADDRLIYVGKSKNLARRVQSYFREAGRPRTPRVQRLLDRLRRFEYAPSGSELEALLREAQQIRRDDPRSNIQRRVRPGRRPVPESILILEPAEAPSVLRAYLIRDGRLLAKVSLGRRGGGLARIRTLLEQQFFATPHEAREPSGRPYGIDVDVEVVTRWLAANRDRAVAFDPTDLAGADEVIARLRWALSRGSPFDADGSPILER